VSDSNNPYGQPGPQGGQPGGPAGPPQYGQQSGPPQYGDQGGMPQYGQAAGPEDGQAGYGQPGPSPTPTERPRPLDLAVKLMYAGAVIAVIDLVIALTQMDAIREMAHEQAAAQGMPEMADAMAGTSIAIGIGVGAISIALWIWMAVMNGKGKSWARILATIFGALAVIGFLFSLAQVMTGIQLVMAVIRVALAIAILVLLWNKASSAYYNAMSNKTP